MLEHEIFINGRGAFSQGDLVVKPKPEPRDIKIADDVYNYNDKDDADGNDTESKATSQDSQK